jgi:hypothetical protein
VFKAAWCGKVSSGRILLLLCCQDAKNHERMLKALEGSDLNSSAASHNGRPGPTVQTRHSRINSVFIEKLGNELFERFTRAIC